MKECTYDKTIFATANFYLHQRKLHPHVSNNINKGYRLNDSDHYLLHVGQKQQQNTLLTSLILLPIQCSCLVPYVS